MRATKEDSVHEVERGRATAERILDAAETLFAQHGFAGTPIRDIAARVELNPASLYNHFPGKQELYEAVLDRGLRPVFEMLAGLASSDWSPSRDDRAIDMIVEHFATRPNLARLLHHEALAGGDNIARLAGRWIGPIYQQGIEALRTSPVLDGWSTDDLPLLVMALHNLILGYFSMAALHEKLLGVDPLSAEALERQKDFLRRATRRLVGGAPLEKPGTR
jgi:AcrR family transcriptional regulator